MMFFFLRTALCHPGYGFGCISLRFRQCGRANKLQYLFQATHRLNKLHGLAVFQTVTDNPESPLMQFTKLL